MKTETPPRLNAATRKVIRELEERRIPPPRTYTELVAAKLKAQGIELPTDPIEIRKRVLAMKPQPREPNRP